MLKLKEDTVLIVLSVVLIIFILFSASFFMVLSDRSFYDKSFDKQGTYDELGVQGVRNTVDYLINYLTSGITETNKIDDIKELSIFSPEERSHLEDVHTAISWVKAIGVSALVLLIIFILRLSMLKDFNLNLRRVLMYGSIATIAVLAIIFFLSLNFGVFFEGFHRILFPQGNYTFTAQHLLIKLFPTSFFIDFSRKMFFHTLILSLILLFLGSTSALAIRNPRRN